MGVGRTPAVIDRVDDRLVWQAVSFEERQETACRGEALPVDAKT
jgi:hypothetical protein